VPGGCSFEPGGVRAGRAGFGVHPAPAGWALFARMFRIPCDPGRGQSRPAGDGRVPGEGGGGGVFFVYFLNFVWVFLFCLVFFFCCFLGLGGGAFFVVFCCSFASSLFTFQRTLGVCGGDHQVQPSAAAGSLTWGWSQPRTC